MKNLAIENKLQGLYNEDAQISLYVADLGAYVAGRLRGVWVSLPLEEDELEALYEMAEELAIHDYECDFMEISEYANIRELNELAEELDGLDESELEVFKAYLDGVCDDYDDALQAVRNQDYIVYYNCDDMADVAREYVDMVGGFECVSNKEYYFDAESYGRDLELDGYNPHMWCGCYQDDCEDCQEALRMQEDGEIDYTAEAEALFEEGCISDDMLEYYFDYEALGRDMEINGNFIFTDNGNCVEFY